MQNNTPPVTVCCLVDGCNTPSPLPLCKAKTFQPLYVSCAILHTGSVDNCLQHGERLDKREGISDRVKTARVGISANWSSLYPGATRLLIHGLMASWPSLWTPEGPKVCCMSGHVRAAAYMYGVSGQR